MPDLLYRSGDGRFGLRLSEACISPILELCSRSGRKETGGVMIGYYMDSLDTAVVTTVTDPPPDSKSGKDWFKRGVRGLNDNLDEHWRMGRFYLGEWHYHPGVLPTPSPTDDARMDSIARLDNYACPAPVLLIVGSAPCDEWMLAAYVYPAGEHRIHLSACE